MKLRYILTAFCRVAVMAGLLFSCSSLTYDVRITNADINARLAAKFPITRTYFRLLEVSFSNPEVVLQEATDKITFSFDVAVAGRAQEQPALLQGSISATSGIRFDNKNGSFYLTDFVIDRVSVPGLAQHQNHAMREKMGAALREYLSRVPVYTLQADKVKTAAEKLVLKDVRISGGVLVVTLGL